jgi:hypothetical protein
MPIAPTPNHGRPDAHGKALSINIDHKRYGTFAEIGAGQEVVRWFFRVGGAAGTVAKSISAYDMAVSDAIYGKARRYVSRERVESMLDHEYELTLERLSATRSDSAFFSFANSVAARNYLGTNDCHGWMGVRFQARAGAPDSKIVLHVRLLDPSNMLQQEAVGLVGLNLLFGAFRLHENPEALLESLMDGLTPSRVEIDLVELSGDAFKDVDNRLTSLRLVQKGLSRAAAFGPDGHVLLPSEVFYKRPLLVERGTFRPVTRANIDILRAAGEKFNAMLPEADRGRVVPVAELTMSSLSDNGQPADVADFLGRADCLAASGLVVLVSDFFEFYKLAGYLDRLTDRRVGVAMGAITVPEVFDPSYYRALAGGLMEAIGKLFRNDLTLFIYPFADAKAGRVLTAEDIDLHPESRPLYDYVRGIGRVVGLDNYDASCLGIVTADLLARIHAGDPAWETDVPPDVVAVIRDHKLFGCAG